MKPTLNEQLTRMQKLAGIITENQSNPLLTLINDYVDYTYAADQGYGTVNVDGEEMNQTKYAALQLEKIKPEIIKLKGEQYFEDVEEFASLKLVDEEYSGEDLTDELEAAVSKLGFSLEDLENNLDESKKSYYKDAEKDDAAHIKALEKDMKDDAKKTSEGKMTKSDLKSKIKEMILAELNEDSTEDVDEPGALNNMYDPLAEAKKDEEVEDITVDDTEVVDAPESDMMAGKTTEVSGIQSNLQAAYAEAKALGDEKLITQIANTITYFTKAHILDTAPINEAINDDNANAIYDILSNMDNEDIINDMFTAMQKNPEMKLEDFLNQYDAGDNPGDDNDDNYDDSMDVYDDSYHDMAEAKKAKGKLDQINENMFPMLKRILK